MRSEKEIDMTIQKFYRYFLPLLCLALVLTLTIGSVQASPLQQTDADFAAIDAYVQEQMENLGIPGLALGIVRDDQITHLQGFGVADSSRRAITPQTPFRIGSLTKGFTALAVMQLVEAGEINLEAPVHTYLPRFELADPEASSKITVRHLLNQTSGFSTKDGNSLWTNKKDLEETVHSLDGIKLTQPVGSTYQYSNINFMIAGLIVEVVSGQPYAEYVTEHIFEPLDMQHAHASIASAHADGLAKGHIIMVGRARQDDGPIPPANLPAGTLIASAEDMTHYAIAQMNDGRYGHSSVLSPQGMDELHKPAIVAGEEAHYAMGWTVGAWEGKRSIYHTGDDGRFHSVMLLLPEQGTGMVLLANASGFIQLAQIDQIAQGVLFMLLDKPAASVATPFLAVFPYWLLLFTPVLQVLGILFIMRRIGRINPWGVLVSVAIYLGLTFLLFRLALQIITLPSMLVFYPELGYALVAVAVLGVGWSVILPANYLWKRRRVSSVQPAAT
jgi:CubicO group peptidase (beta-lactamase class C family)